MNNNILSSIALFSELYKNDKDVFCIIGEFIKASIRIECKYAFTDTEMKQMLENNFNIDIPQPLTSYILRNKLKDDIKRHMGQYIVNNQASLNENQFGTQQRSLQDDYEHIFLSLYNYIETIKSPQNNEIEKDKIKNGFINYLLKQGNSDYSDLFSAFIVLNQFSEKFTDKLNLIIEGLIIYSGIQYKSPEEINQLGSWKNQLTIYLDTEQLFNLIGYNDEYYKKIFDDFFNLIAEINKNTGKKILFLKYFEETQIEIEKYFATAERIVIGKDQLIPGKAAMINILNGCKDEFDVRAKKSAFYIELKNYGIRLDNETKVKDVWNIGSFDLLKKIEEDLKSKNINYNEEEAVRYLSIFSKINTLRTGLNRTSFEKCAYIFLSANNFVRYLSCCEDIKQDGCTPLSTDIDYVTSRIWFALQKPFTKDTTPITFDIITRSQLVLKSHHNNTINERYKELVAKNMSTEAKIDIYKELHYKGTIAAKDINYNSLPEIISFIEMPSIDILIEEKSMYKLKLEAAEKIKDQYESEKEAKQEAEQKVNTYAQVNTRLVEDNKKKDRKYRHLLNTPIKNKIRKIVGWKFVGIYTVIVLVVAFALLLTYWIKQETDTVLTIVSLLLTITAFILPFIKKFRIWILSKIRKSSISDFKTLIKTQYGKEK